MAILLAALAAVALLALVLVTRKSGNPDMTVHIGGRGIFGRILSSLAGVAAPVKTANPSISGPNSPPLVGDTLTATHGTYTGTVTGYAGQWYSGSSPIALATALTYVVQVTDENNNITYQESAYNRSPARSSATGTSNAMGPVSGSTLATPTLSEDSTAGTAPLTLGLSTTDYVAGLNYELQIDQTSSAFSNLTQHIVGFIDGLTWATLDQSAGLITPSGQFWARARILRQNESGTTSVTDQNNVTATYDASAWSNTVNDTIGGSVATLTTGSGSTGSGTNRSQYLNVTSYEAVMNTGNVGAICADRATIAAQNNKFHCEFTAKFFAATGGNSKFWCGFDDGTISYASFVSASSAAGTSGKNGLTIMVAKGSTPSISINGSAFANLTGFATPTDGDVWAFDIDYSGTNPTVLITQYNGTAHVLNGGAITMTTGKPTSWYAFCGGGSGNGTAATGSSDTADFNPSSSHAAWSVTPQTGFNQYG